MFPTLFFDLFSPLLVCGASNTTRVCFSGLVCPSVSQCVLTCPRQWGVAGWRILGVAGRPGSAWLSQCVLTCPHQFSCHGGGDPTGFQSSIPVDTHFVRPDRWILFHRKNSGKKKYPPIRPKPRIGGYFFLPEFSRQASIHR